MKQPSIFITTQGAEKLRKLIGEAFHSEYRGSDYLNVLAEEMEKASVVNREQIPADVITLNSAARLVDQETNEEMVYTLVFAEDADVSQGRISVLAPIGTAVPGYKTGNTLKWETPGGKRTLRAQETLYQPEASGDER